MHVVVTGASGNVGSQVLPHLLREPAVTQVSGLCRRPPARQPAEFANVSWVSVDLDSTAAPGLLREVFTGADAVVHLAWRIQPSHDLDLMRRVNVDGSRLVAQAVVDAGVPALVYASSVGAYSPAPKDRRSDESWPTGGVGTSAYSRHKAAVERILDEVERDAPRLRVVRLRPGLIFQRQAASEIARYFLGPFVPASLVRRGLVPVVPAIDRLRFQAVHASDVGAAYAAAVVRDVRGAFNIAAEPVLDPTRLAELLGARLVPVPVRVLRGLLETTWRLRIQPTHPGWLDLALAAPVMDTNRARAELGWAPTRSSEDALLDLLAGMPGGAGGPTPVLAPYPSAPRRVADALRRLVSGGAG